MKPLNVDRIRRAFGQIVAEEKLKESTMSFLRGALNDSFPRAYEKKIRFARLLLRGKSDDRNNDESL
jgi:hypothetical protein